MELDYERIESHFRLIELFSTCCDQNYFAVKQVRTMIDQDCLFDSIMTTAMPFKLKPFYLELFYRVYVQRIKGLDNLDVNHPRLLDMLNFVMFLDCENFYLYYSGLMVKETPETEEAIRD